MVRTLDPNQIKKIDRRFIEPIYLVHLLLDDVTLYFSDRNYPYNGHNYEAYLSDFSGIESQIRSLGGYDNCQLTLIFRNEKIRDYDTLIEFFDYYPPEKKYIEIYKLLIDTGETFGSDVSTKIFKGEMGQPSEILDPPVDFKINCSSMLFGKNVSLPLKKINTIDFPSADPDDIGKYRNIVIGSVKKVPCRWTVAGWLSTLTADITATTSPINVSDITQLPSLPFSAIIGSEEVLVIYDLGGNDLTVTRGYNSTTAVPHNKGDTIYEKRSDFEAEAAQHPVHSLSDPYVKRNGELTKIVSGFTKSVDGGGRATIVFTDKIKFEEKIDIDTAVDEGSHVHSLTMSDYATKKCIPTGASGGTNPGNAIDGNEDTQASCTNAQTLTVTFTETNLGVINKQYIYILLMGSSTGAIYCGGELLSAGLSAPATKSWSRLVKNGGAWGDNITIQGITNGDNIYEVYKDIEFIQIGAADTHAATGVDVTIIGNSVANIMIGDEVFCDVEGYEDDGNVLIERPDHVRELILMNLLGFVAGDIGASFATVGAIYATQAGGYKFGFILHEVATEVKDLFDKMDLQSRSNMFESGGQFQLEFNSADDPTPEKTFSKDNIKGSFLFGKSEVADLRNILEGHYNRDYSKSGNLGDMYLGLASREDGPSITKYGELREEFEFSCVQDLYDMVADVLEWLIVELGQLKKTVEFEAKWDALILEPCDYFDVITSGILSWSGLKFKTELWKEDRKNQTIQIKGRGYSILPLEISCLWIADTDNHRLSKRDLTYQIDLSMLISKFGTGGAGSDQFESPCGIVPDFDGHDYIYVADTYNFRIEKRRKSNWALIWTVNFTSGQRSTGITIDETYIFNTVQTPDTSKHCIQKRLKTDGSLVIEIGTYGTGNDQFKNPSGISTDVSGEEIYDNYVYIADTGNHRIQKRLKSDLSFDSAIGSQGSGDDQFESPFGISANSSYLVVADTGNHRIQLRLCDDLSYLLGKAGSQGSGDDQFESPKGVAILMYSSSYYFFVADTGNHRLMVLDAGLSYVSKIGSQGLGDNQFSLPAGIAIYSYPIPT